MRRPTVVWWLLASLLLYTALAAFNVFAVITSEPPVRMVIAALTWGTAAVAYWFGYRWLRARRRAGAVIAVLANLLGAIAGWLGVVGSGAISLNAIGSALLLVIVVASATSIDRWTAVGRAGSRGTAVAMIAASSALILGPALPAISEPTRAHATDVDFAPTLACEVPVNYTYADGALREHTDRVEGAVITLDVAWRRAEPLPFGFGDVRVMDHVGADAVAALSYTNIEIVDAQTGERVSAPGVGPGGEFVDPGAYRAPLAPVDLDTGRTVRMRIELVPNDMNRPMDWTGLTIDAWYWHRDLFKLDALLRCDGTVDRFYTGPLDLR